MPFLSIKMSLILTYTVQFHNVIESLKILCANYDNNNFETVILSNFIFFDDNELTVHFVEGARRKPYLHITENALKI